MERDRRMGEQMLTRRKLFTDTATAMAGMVLLGRGVGEAKNARQQSASAGVRRQVAVRGRRVKTVDVHSHCEIPGIREMMGGATPTNSPLIIGLDRMRHMDAQGIDVEVLSINPFRGKVGSISAAQDLCGSWRRLPAVVRRPVGSRVSHLSCAV